MAAERKRISDDEFVPALNRTLQQIPDAIDVVFENIPRSASQAEELISWSQMRSVHLNVVVLELSEDDVVNRSQDRTVCPNCSLSYHPILNPPHNEGFCDHDGIPLVKKPGDDEGKLRRQYREYMQELGSVLGVFTGNSSAQVLKIDARGTVEQTAGKLFEILES